jgi:hypothetical protein
MFLLPVSQVAVTPRAPDGHDELFLAEGAVDSIAQRVATVRRLAPPVDASVDWDALPYADVDAALLAVRRHLQGDRLCAELRCAECGAWGDVVLSVRGYLADKRPRRVAAVTPSQDGWLACKDALFRIPSTAAVLSALGPGRPVAEAATILLRDCVAPGADAGPRPARSLARVSALLDRIAPRLAGLIQGICPQCGQLARGWFDPGQFVLRELQARAGAVFEQIHLIASRYGWSEASILALPSRRRALFAGFIAQDRQP